MKKQRMPLKPREIKFIAGKAKGLTNVAAAMQATGLTNPPSASVIAGRMLKNPSVQEELIRVFEEQGITLERAIEPISKALAATKVVIHGNKEDAFAEVVDDIDLQLKGSDRALKLMGVSQGEGVTNNFLVISEGQRDKYGI